MTHIDTLATAFAALDDVHLRNLLWHVREGTRILCGKQSHLYCDGEGGG
jgi:hypothetical protein